MVQKDISSLQSSDYFHRLSKALGFAVSEWLLMFLLLIDACFTCLIAKFASYCQLQGPCVLCSRYDNVLAKNNKGSYWDSICNHHKSEISSLVLCHYHVSESLSVNAEDAKNEKNIFVDQSLESFEYQKIDMRSSDNELEIPVSDIIPEVHLKSNSQFEVHDLHNDSATIAARGLDEIKWRNDENKDELSRITEDMSFEEVPSSNNAETRADAFLDTIDPPIINEAIKDPVTESDQSTTTNGYQIFNDLDLGDAYKLAISTKGRQLSGKLLDQKSFKDSSKILLLSHRSKDSLLSPKLSFNSDELMGMQLLQSRISLERNGSNVSFDGSVVSEIEGETVVDRLKRQVEHDKKVMGVLYKELEEERNASAVAANQAMAMITRLQEEKAALYTEALQCLRMMEEQAEYDNEALQSANDIIQEKDKQIQDSEKLVTKIFEDVRE